MRPFTDLEFTLVTQKPAAETQEALRLLTLLGRLRKKKPKQTDEKSFAYDFPNMLSRMYVTGRVEAYEAPYTGSRIVVRATEGAFVNVINTFAYFVLNPILIMTALLEGEPAFLAFFVIIGIFAFWHWYGNVIPAMERTKTVLAEIFHAAPESPQPVIRDEP